MIYSLRPPLSLKCVLQDSKWNNIARLYGSFAELWFFQKEENDKSPASSPEWPSLRYDYRQFYGLDNGMFEPGQLPDLTALGSSGEWT